MYIFVQKCMEKTFEHEWPLNCCDCICVAVFLCVHINKCLVAAVCVPH